MEIKMRIIATHSVFKTFWIHVMVILLGTGLSYAQPVTESKKFIKAFPVHADSKVEIENKYGKVQIVTWKKDSVRFEVDLKIYSSNAGKIEKIRNNIDFDFSSTGYYITARTRFGKRYNSLFDGFKKIIPAEDKVTIDYLVMIPDYIDLYVDNKFGDVYVDDISGDFKLVLSNGDLKADHLRGNTILDLTQCHGRINSLMGAQMNLSYTEIEMERSGALDITSRSSEVIIGAAGSLKIQSRRDKYYLSDAGGISGESYFTDLRMDEFRNEINLKMKYGSLIIGSVQQDFSFLTLSSSFADVDLYLDRGISAVIDLSYKETEIYYAHEFNQLEEKIVDENEGYRMAYGIIGNAGATSRIHIDAEKGSIRIFRK